MKQMAAAKLMYRSTDDGSDAVEWELEFPQAGITNGNVLQRRRPLFGQEKEQAKIYFFSG